MTEALVVKPTDSVAPSPFIDWYALPAEIWEQTLKKLPFCRVVQLVADCPSDYGGLHHRTSSLLKRAVSFHSKRYKLTRYDRWLLECVVDRYTEGDGGDQLVDPDLYDTIAVQLVNGCQNCGARPSNWGLCRACWITAMQNSTTRSYLVHDTFDNSDYDRVETRCADCNVGYEHPLLPITNVGGFSYLEDDLLNENSGSCNGSGGSYINASTNSPEVAGHGLVNVGELVVPFERCCVTTSGRMGLFVGSTCIFDYTIKVYTMPRDGCKFISVAVYGGEFDDLLDHYDTFWFDPSRQPDTIWSLESSDGHTMATVVLQSRWAGKFPSERSISSL